MVAMKFQNISVNLNNKCNFDCDYCFIKNKTDDEISYETLHDLRRFINRYGEKEIQLDIFGTEPLISWDKLVHLIRMQHKWKVGITTNGSLVSEDRARFLAEHNVGVLVSYDGSRKSHNRFRKFKSGQGTWQAVLNGVRRLNRAGVKYACAMTVSPENLPYLLHNVKSAASRGFEFIALNPQFTIGEEPHPTGYDWELFRKKYREAAEWAVAHQIPLKFTIEAIKYYGYKHRAPLKSTCGAARGSIAVDWDGRVYICHRGCGREEFQVGDIINGIQTEMINGYRMRDINPCHVCPVYSQRGSCGHCWTLAKDLTGDMNKVPKEVCLWQTIVHEIDLDIYRYYSDDKEQSFNLAKSGQDISTQKIL